MITVTRRIEWDAARLLWDWADHVERGRRAPFGFNGEPTAETIAARLFGVAEELMAADGIAVESVPRGG